ncbi:MAG: hypothetical protein U1F35_07410, partial [Steroidobacteraceae bacterium]
YNHRHNEANLESGADGHAHNLSWNGGVEGETADAGVRTLRVRQSMNLLATLMLSQGVPMLQAGDELGRTQGGNNNAYCQDNEISWIDWPPTGEHGLLLDFTRRLTRLRRNLRVFRRETFLKGVRRGGYKDVTWLRAEGGEMGEEQWLQPQRRTIGINFGLAEASRARVLMLVNAAHEPVSFQLPEALEGWRLLFDTALEARGEEPIPAACFHAAYQLESLSIVLLEA